MSVRDEIRVGWRVKISDFDYGPDGRDDVTVEEVREDGSLILRTRKPWASQGRSFATMHLTWTGDVRMAGRTVYLYRDSFGRQIVTKAFTFFPPPGEW